MHFREMQTSADFIDFLELRAERPKVMYNEVTNKYVMWYYADTFDQQRRLIGACSVLCLMDYPALLMAAASCLI